VTCDHRDIAVTTGTFDVGLDGITLGTMTAEIMYCVRCGSTFWTPANPAWTDAKQIDTPRSEGPQT
jgi:hypothetical protein